MIAAAVMSAATTPPLRDSQLFSNFTCELLSLHQRTYKPSRLIQRWDGVSKPMLQGVMPTRQFAQSKWVFPGGLVLSLEGQLLLCTRCTLQFCSVGQAYQGLIGQLTGAATESIVCSR